MDFTIVKDRRLVAFFFGLLPDVAMISKIDRTVVSIAVNLVEIMRTANIG
ncbi:MAG: hypothetical protein OSA89_17750 [Mariniblastus sp.]|jgi:hypothetical protein|nr:hypothetical protein [Mariniblastus sp.]|tara:strand:- start:1044 stop:1193 length:150 start_codon:yes stop_codon:yes gene_type:complete